uniref:hypothetical protein n=1 Tax=Actinomadura sp. CA-154981 TaxID=3240037 RepID=UPI003F491940
MTQIKGDNSSTSRGDSRRIGLFFESARDLLGCLHHCKSGPLFLQGHPEYQGNDFIDCVVKAGPELGNSSFMNCYEYAFFAAWRKGLVDKKTLIEVHGEALESVMQGPPPPSGEAPAYNYYQSLTRYICPELSDPHQWRGGINEAPDIPAGWIVVLGNIWNHVGVSCGTRDSMGRQQVLGLSKYPDPGPSGRGMVQVSTLDELMERNPDHAQYVRWGIPGWC